MFVFIFLVKFGQLSDRLLENSCSPGLRYVYKYLSVDLVLFPAFSVLCVGIYI